MQVTHSAYTMAVRTTKFAWRGAILASVAHSLTLRLGHESFDLQRTLQEGLELVPVLRGLGVLLQTASNGLVGWTNATGL